MNSRLIRAAVSAAFVLIAANFALAGGRAYAAVPSKYQVSWDALVSAPSKGYTVSLAPQTLQITDASPRFNELRVRFDTYDPPTKNYFNAERNIYARPQREIALYWGGIEVVRRLCPVPLVGPTGNKTGLFVNFVTGGAEISVRVGSAVVYDRYFIPDVAPFAARISTGGDAALRHFAAKAGGPPAPIPSPYRVRAIDNQLIDKDHYDGDGIVRFPEQTDGIGRVICTLRLARTAHGVDPWDRIGNVYVYSDSGEKFELLRFITPYRRGYTWSADVTDLLPLLVGKKRIAIRCETYGEGWLASVDFTFYRGPIARVPYKVVNLWNTIAVIGQAANPFEKQMPAQTIPIDPQADATSVRLIATGHGEDPNSDNAAEFISLWRKLTVGDKSFTNTLWKDDNYLNPCRPQGGTWKFDRAGWGPGTVVTPWTVDVTPYVRAGKPATFQYEIQPYVNKTPNNGNPARYVIGSQVIYYRLSR